MKKLAFLFIILYTSSFPQAYPVIPDFLISGDDNSPSTYIQNSPKLYLVDNNNFIVSWADYREGYASIYAQKYDKNGNKIEQNFNSESNTGIYLNKNGSLLSLNTVSNTSFTGDTYYKIFARLFNSNNIELKNEDIYNGIRPWCGTGYIPGGENISASENSFYFLSNYGGNLALAKIEEIGTIKHFPFDSINYITQITSSATSNGNYFSAWVKGTNYDSSAMGLYGVFINPEDSIIKKEFLIYEVADSIDEWNYLFYYDLRSVALNDSTYKLFWLNNKSLMLYSVKLNTAGEIISDIDSIKFSQPDDKYSVFSNMIITNKQNDGFYLKILWRTDTDPPIYKNSFIKYSPNGDLLSIYSGERTPGYLNNIFYAGSGNFFEVSSYNQDVYLIKIDTAQIIDSSKINDDKSGSNQINQRLVNYGNDGVFEIWKDEVKSYGISIDKNGVFTGSKMELDNTNISFFPDKEFLTTWIIKDNDSTYAAGYSIYDSNFNEQFSKTLITKNTNYNLRVNTHIISDSVFIILLNETDEIKLIKEERNGKTVAEKIISTGSIVYGEKMYFDDYELTKNEPDYFWLSWSNHLQKYSLNFEQLSDEKIFKYGISSYLGDDKFLVVMNNYDFFSNVTSIGMVLNSDMDTLKSFPIGYFPNDNYNLQIGRISNNEFLTIRKYGKSYYARAYTNEGVAKKDSFLINVNSTSSTSNLNFTVNNDKVYFSWSDAKTPGKGYDVHCNIFNLSTITDIKENSIKTPDNFFLYQNYPNPFNPSTVIKYELAKPGFVHITLYDVLGRKIRDLFTGNQEAGAHEINFDASNFTNSLSSGIYLYRIVADYKEGIYRSTKKMVLLK